MTNLGIFKFLKKSVCFLIIAKFLGVAQIKYKNGTEISHKQANQILLSRNRPKQSPYFFRTHFQMESNYFEMKLHFQTSSFSLDISQLCR